MVVDTTELNVNQLRERLADLFSGDDASAMQILVLSFGFKHGVPLDVDNVFDVRFLPNPHWVEAMRPAYGPGRAGAPLRPGPAGGQGVPGKGRPPVEVPRPRLHPGGQVAT